MTSATDVIIDSAVDALRKSLQRDLAELAGVHAAEIEELKDEVAKAEEGAKDVTADVEAIEDALIQVRDWFYDVTVFGKPMSDPRKILQIVERAIG